MRDFFKIMSSDADKLEKACVFCLTGLSQNISLHIDNNTVKTFNLAFKHSLLLIVMQL